MDPLGSHDYYSLLGVPRSASAEAIRAAFLASVKKAHPDRIDRSSSPLEWEFANQLMAALTRAYGVLRDPAQRAMYDAALGTTPKPSGSSRGEPASGASRPTPDPRRAALRKAQGAVVRGSAYFHRLSPELQAELRGRQESDSADSVRRTTESAFAHYVGVLVLGGWLWYLFSGGSSGYAWALPLAVGYYSITGLLSWWSTASIRKIYKWHRAPLRPSFYLTRLHYVVTTLDSVSFWPLWEFRDASVVHHYTNGVYQHSTLSFSLGDDALSLQFQSKDEVEAFWKSLRSFQTDAIGAEQRLDVEYFQRNNRFSGVATDPVKAGPGLPRRWAVAAILVGVATCFAASVKNDQLRDSKWFKHAALPAIPSTTPSRPSPNPFLRPAPEGSPTAIFANSHPPQPLPPNGEVRTSSRRERIAPLTVRTDAGDFYLVKLVDSTRGTQLTVFIRGGAPLEVDVPLGTYELRYASGATWFGYEFLFGPETSYAKADKSFTFSRSGDSVSGYEVTLYKVRDGNLHTTEIAADKF
ncbi:MAG: DnaJ domain-containing protein [Planctomycetes bacterium]|nr:DnaJ domain-containing protein [Planctomycetota bacterium]